MSQAPISESLRNSITWIVYLGILSILVTLPTAQLRGAEQGEAPRSETPEMSEWPVAALAAQLRAAEGRSRAHFWLQIPGEALPTDRDLSLDIAVEAVDAQGTVQGQFSRSGTWPRAELEPFRDSGIKCHGDFELPPGSYRLRMSITESGQGVRSRRDLPFEVKTFKDGQSSLVPPLFLDDDEEFEVLREPLKTGVIDPFVTAAEESFIPQVVPLLEEGALRSRITLLGYHLLKEQSLLDIRLVTADGFLLGKERLGLVSTADTATDGFDRLDFSLQTEGLVPGEYQLEVSIQDLENGRTDQTLMPFVIR